jgi:hypothetical protein
MILESEKKIEKLGERVGYVLAYFLFTTVFYSILIIAHKIPSSWSYMHILFIALLIVALGRFLEMILK